jgi:hypothetical protein
MGGFDIEECLMGSPSFAPDLHSQRRLRLSEIDSIVSARLGPTRGLGNSQPAEELVRPRGLRAGREMKTGP